MVIERSPHPSHGAYPTLLAAHIRDLEMELAEFIEHGPATEKSVAEREARIAEEKAKLARLPSKSAAVKQAASALGIAVVDLRLGGERR